jgi:hypothetical protein
MSTPTPRHTASTSPSMLVPQSLRFAATSPTQRAATRTPRPNGRTSEWSPSARSLCWAWAAV